MNEKKGHWVTFETSGKREIKFWVRDSDKKEEPSNYELGRKQGAKEELEYIKKLLSEEQNDNGDFILDLINIRIKQRLKELKGGIVND